MDNENLIEEAIDTVFRALEVDNLPLLREIYCDFITPDLKRIFFVLYHPKTEEHLNASFQVIQPLLPFIWGSTGISGYGLSPNTQTGQPVKCKLLRDSTITRYQQELVYFFPVEDEQRRARLCHLTLLELVYLLFCPRFEEISVAGLTSYYYRAHPRARYG